MRIIHILCYLICISVFMAAGCAPTKQEIPTEEIRGRADRAFDELQKEETGEKGISEGERSSALPPPEKPPQEKSGEVQATQSTRPDWVDGESVQYPESRYLTGVGYDADRKVSKDKARAEIAKIFVSEINSRTRSYQDYLQISSGGTADLEETFSIQEITDVSTKKVFSGVRIAYLYQDSGPGNLYYALAVLDRQQSSTILINRILRLDGEIDMLLDRARGEGDLLTKIKYLTQSIGKHAMREAYDAELRIVSPAGRGISPSVQFAEIKSRLDAILLREFKIGVSVSGTRANEVQDALEQGLHQEGFSVSEDLSAAHVLIKGAVEIKPLERGTAEWKYVGWRAQFDMVDTVGGSVFGSFTKTGREGHLTLRQAEERAVRKIRDTLAGEMAGEVRNYIFSQ
jgi:hypothetical protein